eukprot:TRINITY_DN9104_c0_g2_i8.p1 TRINITY_DN9104_c0_g2~~TRINITY_DN9104_c0_g2_i8.p1  ORF type:complete len:192 (+),score=19.87 TRINITY_DN9104_c0_g2_i8:69-644(+)
MAANLYPAVQPISKHPDMLPTTVLGRSARNAFMSSSMGASPMATRTPRYMDRSLQKEDPFPSYRPMTGKHGIVCPGSQYWTPCADTGRFDADSLVSETMNSFVKRPELSADLERTGPLSARTHGNGTGYCPNTTSIIGADWTHKDHLDTFRTTYGDSMNTGFCQKNRLSPGTHPLSPMRSKERRSPHPNDI